MSRYSKLCTCVNTLLVVLLVLCLVNVGGVKERGRNIGVGGERNLVTVSDYIRDSDIKTEKLSVYLPQYIIHWKTLTEGSEDLR